MTKAQIEGLLNTISGAYKRYARNESTAEKTAELTIWYEMLKNDDPVIVGRVLREHIALSVFPPTIAEIRAGIRRLTMPDPAELLKILNKQGNKSLKEKMELVEELTAGRVETYRHTSLKTEAFNELPEVLKLYVKTPTGLQDWYREYVRNTDAGDKAFMKEIVKLQERMDVTATLDAPRQIGGER